MALTGEVSPRLGSEVGPDLILTFRVEGVGHGVEAIQMRCVGVRRLILPEMAPHFWTSEIEIDDLTGSQLEGSRYCVMDYGGDLRSGATKWLSPASACSNPNFTTAYRKQSRPSC